MIVDSWAADPVAAAPVRVWPDGCRDVIWAALPGAAPRWVVSPLDTRLRLVSGLAGARMRGWRLAPGTGLPADLPDRLDPETPDAAPAAIAALCRPSPETADLVAACAAVPGAGVARLARALGVAPRTLQRRIGAVSGQGPQFWLRLVRLRAALALARDGVPLAGAAAEAGFADQAHFTREARAFHGAPPGRLLADPQALAAILAPGLQPLPSTLVHSSTSVPSGART